MLVFSVVIGVIFGFLAAASAFAITWHEYEKHKFTGKRLFKEAFQSAVFTLVVFLLLSLIIGFLLTRFVINKPMS
jgi:protein-S-isoprenylcysteine O-methyltransferase Ste14